MTEAEQLKTLACTQATARHYVSYRGTLEKIIESVRYVMGPDAPDADTLSTFLRKESTQRTLAGSYEVGLWRSIDKSWRLISLAVPVDIDRARRRLSHFPDNSGCQCSWCFQSEGGLAAQELRPELNLKREPVQPPRYLHPLCMRPWLAMRYLVERAEIEPLCERAETQPPPPITVPILAPPKRGPGRPRKSQ